MIIAEDKQGKESRKVFFMTKRLDYDPRPECQRIITGVQKQSLLNEVKTFHQANFEFDIWSCTL